MEVAIPKSMPCKVTSNPNSSSKSLGSLCYFSAPSSPSRAAAIYDQLKTISQANSGGLYLDGKMTGGKSDVNRNVEEDEERDFAFEFSGPLERVNVIAAEELFEKGKIRPLNVVHDGLATTRSSLNSWPGKPDRSDYSESAVEGSQPVRVRGRERSPSTNGRRTARSHSPLRVSHFAPDEPGPVLHPKPGFGSRPPRPPAKSSTRRWSFKDFLLFRSASEGRATSGRDPLRRFSILARPKMDDSRNSSFRSMDGSGSVRRNRLTPPQQHYTANRAASEELRRKTFLPYRQNLLGCLGFGFNPAVHHLDSRFPSISRV